MGVKIVSTDGRTPDAKQEFLARPQDYLRGTREDPLLMEKAFEEVDAALAAGELVCIFPEGKLTADGEMNEFRGGVTRILEETPVPVIPMALQGLWGSFFSRDPNKGVFRRLWSRVTLVAERMANPS